jgi:anthranilate synthase component 2
MKILVFDNYDSFTYNLVHIIRELGYGDDMDIYRNDRIPVEDIASYDKILLSPGPGLPADAGIMELLIKTYARDKSILGICLGHQGIAEVFGARIFNLPVVLHGVTKVAHLTCRDELLFRNIPDHVRVCRYHSWAVAADSIPDDLEITAIDEENVIMGIRHRKLDVRGLQFHPEAYLTEHGIQMINNWLKN